MSPAATRPARAVGEDAKAERREAILAAAKATFATKGFHDTKIADVARSAGISYGSVYWYFDSKDALFHDLLDHEEAALREHIAVRTADLGPQVHGVDLFRASVRATFEFFERDHDLVQLLFRDSLVLGPRFDRHLSDLLGGFLGDIESAILLAQAGGHLTPAPARVVAFSVVALISQLALRRLSTDDGMGADELADLVVRMVLDGLRPRPDPTLDPGGTPS